MTDFKQQGNTHFKNKDFRKAIEFYSKQILATPEDHTVLGNRAAAFQNMGDYISAKQDAERIIKLKPEWSKGHQRKGEALAKCSAWTNAIKSFEEAVRLDPANGQAKTALDQAILDQLNPPVVAEAPKAGGSGNPMADMMGAMGGMGGMGDMMGGMGGGGGGNPFGEMFDPVKLQKMKTLPKFASYFADPMFAQKYEMCVQNSNMFMQMMGSDDRFMSIFQELSGINLDDLAGEEDAQKDSEASAVRREEERQAKLRAEEDAKKAAEALLDPKEITKKEANEKKLQGNAAYKNKNFEAAIGFYSEAIALNDLELAFYTNLAAVYFEMKEFDKCIEQCDIAVSKSTGQNYDALKHCKALGRKANALASQHKYAESIDTFKNALLEYNDSTIRANYNSTQKARTKWEAEQYIDPIKAEEHKVNGNDKFKAGDYPGAVKEFEEGLKRNPKNVALYSNRCSALIKLMSPVEALKDAQKCIDLDPTFIKAYSKKGACHHLMKEYHKAIRAYDEGLALDANNVECTQGKQKTMYAVNTQSASGGDDEAERQRHAMADPEVQAIMQNPMIQQVLKDLNENPAAGQAALRDPIIMKQINVLIAAGVLKTA